MHLAIIGNGITGVTAALRVRKHHPDWRISLISGESTHHYSRPALMYIFMGHMRYQDTKPYEDGFWNSKRLELIRDWVTGIDTDRSVLSLHRGAPLPYDKLLIATGSQPNRFGWPGQDLKGVQGLWGLMDLKLLHDNCQDADSAVIVGGGLIGIELAEMLHSRNLRVTFFVREASYWDNVLPKEESAMINRAIRRSGMDLRLATELDRIESDASGRVCAVVSKAGERVSCQIVGLTAGVSPNTDVAKSSGIPTGRGILVDQSLRTPITDVFAAGDCAEIVTEGDQRNLIQQVWYTGKAQGEVVGDVIAGVERRYAPGTWYNSAKFLDVEYQTYGRVNMNVQGEASLYWEHPEGNKSLRLVHVDGTIIGFNLMGIRYRHEVCARWIEESRSVSYVLEHLKEANFDPEFFERHEPAIQKALSQEVA